MTEDLNKALEGHYLVQALNALGVEPISPITEPSSLHYDVVARRLEALGHYFDAEGDIPGIFNTEAMSYIEAIERLKGMRCRLFISPLSAQ